MKEWLTDLLQRWFIPREDFDEVQNKYVFLRDKCEHATNLRLSIDAEERYAKSLKDIRVMAKQYKSTLRCV